MAREPLGSERTEPTMPSETHALSGHGSMQFTNNTQNWNQLYAELTTAGATVRYMGVTSPRKLIHAGWVAIGFSNPVNTPTNEMTWYRWLEFEKQRWLFSPNLYNDRLIWDVAVGSVITVTTFY